MSITSKKNSAIFSYALLSLLITFMGDFVAAQTSVSSNSLTLTFAGHTATVHGIVFSVILFITGAYLCFLGGVFQKFTIFIVGFYIGGNIAYIVLTNAKADYGENTPTIILCVCIAVGLVLGALLSCCFFLAVYLVGALLGYIAALWLLSWSTNGLIQSNWGRAILIIIFVIVGVVLIAFLERPIFVIASACVGSFAIFAGIDIYAKTGFLELVNRLLHAQTLDGVTEASTALRGMLGGCLALAIVSALIQWCCIRHRKQEYIGWRDRYPSRAGWTRV